MKSRKLGTQGLEVSAIGLGTMGMTGLPGMPNIYGEIDEQEAILTIHRALDLGICFFDTAEVYGPFENEILLGKALKGHRDQAIIATKFAYAIGNDGSLRLDSSPANLVKALEGSLKRLGIDTIDLWYQHRVDPHTPIEETVGAMARCVEQGKVRFLGLSEASVKTIRRAHAVHPISALQTEYSLWERGVEEKILPCLRELEIGFVPYSPLGRGFLTGTAKRAEEYPESDYRRRDPRYQGKNFDKNIRIVEEVTRIANAKNVLPAQIALAWLLYQGDSIVPIPGTKRRNYLEQNAGAIAITLSEPELSRLSALCPQGTTAGNRYEPSRLALIDQ